MRELTWVSLADQRPGREQHWLSRMPATRTTVLSASEPLTVPPPLPPVQWREVTYRRPVRRFVEAGALAWVRDLDRAVPRNADWAASLECCALVAGQLARLVRERPALRQAVVTWENDPRQPLYRVPPYSRALRDTLGTADLFLCMIESAADHLRVLGVPSRYIEVVRPGADLTRFRPAANPVAEPVIAFVSPLAANKGIDRVLAAMPSVRRAVPDARLVVRGSGPLEPLVRAAAARPDSGVEFLGSGDADAVAATLRSAAVFVTAPRANYKWSEQFGLAYLEALACGLPVITTASGTNHEALPEGNVRVVDRADALAGALVAMLRAPGARGDVGRANRAYAQAHHDLDVQTAQLGAAFDRAETRAPRCST